MPLTWVKRNAHCKQGLENTGDQVPPRPRSQNIYIWTTPTITSRWRTPRSYQLNINGLKEEWRKLFTSEPWILHWTETVDVTTCPRSGITSSRRQWQMEQGPPMEGGPAWGILLAFPLISNAIWRLRHTDEGCSDSRKLCKCCQIFILRNEVANIWIEISTGLNKFHCLVQTNTISTLWQAYLVGSLELIRCRAHGFLPENCLFWVG